MQKFFTTLFLFLATGVGHLLYAQTGYDPAVQAITSPSSGCALGIMPLTVTLNHLGSAPDEIIGAQVCYDYTTPLGSFSGNCEFTPDLFQQTPTTFTFADPIDLSLPGTYTFTVYVVFPSDDNITNSTITKTVVNAGAPIPVSFATPYFEDFENVNTWTSGGTNSSWALGTPAAPIINSAYSGTKSWVTNLTGQYNNNEQSFVISPCFDLTAMDAPVYEMAAWWSSQNNTDGTVLQYSVDGGVTWTRVGANGDSVNWYNSGSITANPGGQNQGWSGTGSTSSSGWRIVRHDLTNLAGVAGVRFRVAFASNNSTTNEGFAFDNVRIFDKNPHDVRMTDLLPFPTGCGLSATQPIVVRLYNNGINEATDFSVTYEITGALGQVQTATETFNDTIAPFSYADFTFAQTANLADDSAFSFLGYTTYALDVNNDNNDFGTSFLNSLHNPNTMLNFEVGDPLTAFSVTTRPRSNVYTHPLAGYLGSGTGMVMDGNTEQLGWSEFDALTNPWGPNSNPERFSQAMLCVRTPDSVATLHMKFYLKQLYNSSFLNTNFRVTVNGQTVPVTRGGSPFVPAGNQQALRPDLNGPSTSWQLVEVDLTPYLDSTMATMQIAFESSVRGVFNPATPNVGNANLIDSIMFSVTYDTTILISSPPVMAFGSKVSVYPNPSSGQVTVELNAIENESYVLEVTDITGKLISRETFRGNGVTARNLDLTAEAKGIYFLKVSSDSHTETRKLVLH